MLNINHKKELLRGLWVVPIRRLPSFISLWVQLGVRALGFRV